MRANGNCLLNAFLYHLNGHYDDELVHVERNEIVNYTEEHESNFVTIFDKEKYRNDYEFLLGEHILAWHLLREINIVLFEYDFLHDGLAVRYWYKTAFKHKGICGLLYSHFVSGHYDYVAIKITDEPTQFQIQPDGVRNIDIDLFDIDNDVPSIRS